MLIAATQVLSPDDTHEPGWIDVTGTQITAVGSGKPPGTADYAVETLAPGFIDAHNHGGAGYSFNDPDPQAARRIADTYLQHGTTTMLASLVTAPLDELIPTVKHLSENVRAGVIAGIHLEGPWLSPDHRGAHDPAFLHTPRLEDVRKILEAGVGTIRMITLAPELPGSYEAIREITAHGVVAALGHTGASYEQTRLAIDAGARVGTHLFNAMTPIHHRRPGPVSALLENRSVFAEIIADGVHLHPAMIHMIFSSPCKPVLVTDAMAWRSSTRRHIQAGGPRRARPRRASAPGQQRKHRRQHPHPRRGAPLHRAQDGHPPLPRHQSTDETSGRNAEPRTPRKDSSIQTSRSRRPGHRSDNKSSDARRPMGNPASNSTMKQAVNSPHRNQPQVPSSAAETDTPQDCNPNERKLKDG